MPSIVLRLYVVMSLPHSKEIVEQVRQILDAELAKHYTLKVFNVESDIRQAERDNILAVPALLRVEPKPVKKIIGDISDRDHLLSALDLPSKKGAKA